MKNSIFKSSLLFFITLFGSFNLLFAQIQSSFPGCSNGGSYSNAFGENSSANSTYSFAAGNAAVSDGSNAFSLGEATLARGDISYALGVESSAYGHLSFVLGESAFAYGDYSIALGTGSIARANNSFVWGTESHSISPYNGGLSLGHFVSSEQNNAFVIGTGASSASLLANTIPNSLIIGFDNNSTLFVNSGSVGINNTSPNNALDVNGTVEMTGFKLTTNPVNNHVLTSDGNGNGTWQALPPSGDNDWTINGNDMYSAVSGDVGVGNSSPVAKLDVFSSSVGTSEHPIFRITDDRCSDLPPNPVYSNIFEVRKKTLDALLNCSNENLLVFSRSGKMGIGIDDPQHHLSVEGNMFITGEYSSLLFGDDLSLDNGEWGIEYFDNGLNFWKPHGSSDGNGGTSTTRNHILFLHDNGNIGIGTDAVTDNYKLSVKGSIRAEEIEVYIGGWADFVFSDDYELMNLSDLSSFIESNKHLPGVPTEKEVLENGVPLGEMNKILLQKVEEMTLYIIDLQNQIDELKQK